MNPYTKLSIVLAVISATVVNAVFFVLNILTRDIGKAFNFAVVLFVLGLVCPHLITWLTEN